jgi:hypothetical protein
MVRSEGVDPFDAPVLDEHHAHRGRLEDRLALGERLLEVRLESRARDVGEEVERGGPALRLMATAAICNHASSVGVTARNT